MSDKASGSAYPLEGAERDWMQTVFADDFSGVHLVAHPPAAMAVNRGSARRVGVSQGNQVFVSPHLSGAARRLVLAHELAHVQQWRNALTGCGIEAGSAALEREAHGAALTAISGGRVRCRLADTGATPRYWGVAGHYYTTYLVLMAAGCGNRMSYEMAFYAQMPDQVDELDATSAGIDIYTRSVAPGLFGPTGGVPQPSADSMRAMAQDYDVQLGLHCLTGGSSAAETQRRRTVLETAGLLSFEFGLAIHPFGDSFAHRVLDDPGRMYGPMLGHAVEAARGKDAHAPDFINRRPALYREYGETLYDIVRAKASVGSPLLSRAALGSRLSDIARESSDGTQINAIRGYAELDLCQIVQPYKPEAETLAVWSSFRAAHPEIDGSLLTKALDLARRWARAS